MSVPANIKSVVGQFIPVDLVDRVEDLAGAGGFSGARLWRIQGRTEHTYAAEAVGGHDWAVDSRPQLQDGGACRTFCLRRWPQGHPSVDRLAWIHKVLLGLRHNVRLPVAAPIPNQAGSTILSHGGALWEWTAWMPGQADFAVRPSRERVLAAVRFLADFHREAVQIDGARRMGVPEVVGARLRQIDEYQRSVVSQLVGVPPETGWSALREFVRPTVEMFRGGAERLRRQLSSWKHAVPIVPCIRDIWHAHLFFDASQLVGVVDFGAMRHETVAGDLSRLLGSLLQYIEMPWGECLDDYAAVGELGDSERELVTLLDASAAFLTPMQWLQWLLLERRRFEDPNAVELRFLESFRRLCRMADVVHALPASIDPAKRG
ncbi:MAG: hypothetical protein FJ295_10900 [Planctomycetes bacterium]|nr:hypothetical protein [Planctomycetota bacterium]